MLGNSSNLHILAFASIAFVSIAFIGSPSIVSAAEEARTPQQERMGACNKMAGQKELKGDDRNKFMSSCLRANFR